MYSLCSASSMENFPKKYFHVTRSKPSLLPLFVAYFQNFIFDFIRLYLVLEAVVDLILFKLIIIIVI